MTTRRAKLLIVSVVAAATSSFSCLNAQAMPQLRWSAGYSRAFDAGGYGFTVDGILMTRRIGPGASLEVGMSAWYGRTGVRSFSQFDREMIGIGPTANVRVKLSGAGLGGFAGATAQYIHNSNGNFIGGAIDVPPNPSPTHVEDARSATAHGLGVGGQFGLIQSIGDQFGLMVSTFVLHQTLFQGAAPWVIRYQVGVTLALR